jgi:hypothetical protein
MSYPIYSMPHTDSKVKIYINGKVLSTHIARSKHSKYLNFVGDLVPDIVENHETGTFDINLEEFVNKVIAKYLDDKTVRESPKSTKKKG